MTKRLPHAILCLSVAFSCATQETKQFVVLAATAEIPDGTWLEIAAPEPLLTPAYHHQVCFQPVAPFRLADDPMGVVDEHGKPVVVHAAALGTAGKLDLPLSAYQDTRICYGISDQNLEQVFERIALSASQVLPIERLEWQSTDK